MTGVTHLVANVLRTRPSGVIHVVVVLCARALRPTALCKGTWTNRRSVQVLTLRLAVGLRSLPRAQERLGF